MPWDEPAAIGDEVASPQRRVRAADVLAILLRERDPTHRQAGSEERHLVFNLREDGARLYQCGRRPEKCPPHQGMWNGTDDDVAEVVRRGDIEVVDVVFRDIG